MRRKFTSPELPWASFSDAMSGMLFVFIITTVWFSLQLNKARFDLASNPELARAAEIRRLQGQVEMLSAKLAPTSGGSSKGKDPGEWLVDDREKSSLASCLGSTKAGSAPLKVEADLQDLRLSLYLRDESVAWFHRNKTTFADEGAASAAVRRIATCVKELISLDDPRLRSSLIRVYIEGHTDADQFQHGIADTTNWELSGQRAARVLRLLLEDSSEVSDALDSGKIELIAVGWADRKPTFAGLCNRLGPGHRDAIDDQVCAKGRESAGEVMGKHAYSFRDVNRGCQPWPRLTPEPRELLRRWANRCVDGVDGTSRGPKTEKRLELLRRVDLRIELVPKGPS